MGAQLAPLSNFIRMRIKRPQIFI